MGTVKSLACTDRIHSVFLMAIISQVLIMLRGCIWSTWHLRSKNNYGRHMKVIYLQLAEEERLLLSRGFPRKTPHSICLDRISEALLCSQRPPHNKGRWPIYKKEACWCSLNYVCVVRDHIFMQLGQGTGLMFLNIKGGDVTTDPIIWQWMETLWNGNIWGSKISSNIHDWNLTQISHLK